MDNEDEDDARETCAHDDGDHDGDGEDDEDQGDLLGTIVSFSDNVLTLLTVNGDRIDGVVTADTEIEVEDGDEAGDGDGDGDGDEGSAADLQPGVGVAEIEFVDDTNELEEVEIHLSTAPGPDDALPAAEPGCRESACQRQAAHAAQSARRAGT